MRALVTGGSRGIGRAIAERLLSRGYDVVVAARDFSSLGTLSAAHASRVLQVTADLSTEGGRATLLSQVAGQNFNALIFAAGIVEYKDSLATSDELLRRHLATNFESAFALARDLSKQVVDGGALVFVASTLAETTAPNTAAYAASKAALVSAMRSFALSLGGRGVRVNAISPGIVETEMLSKRPKQEQEALLALHPLGHFASVEDIADATEYLLDSPFVTATNLTIDAGLTLRS